MPELIIAPRIIPLNNSKHAYLHTADGRLLHLSTSSDKFTEELAALLNSTFKVATLAELENLAQTFVPDPDDPTNNPWLDLIEKDGRSGAADMEYKVVPARS